MEEVVFDLSFYGSTPNQADDGREKNILDKEIRM